MFVKLYITIANKCIVHWANGEHTSLIQIPSKNISIIIQTNMTDLSNQIMPQSKWPGKDLLKDTLSGTLLKTDATVICFLRTIL